MLGFRCLPAMRRAVTILYCWVQANHGKRLQASPYISRLVENLAVAPESSSRLKGLASVLLASHPARARRRLDLGTYWSGQALHSRSAVTTMSQQERHHRRAVLAAGVGGISLAGEFAPRPALAEVAGTARTDAERSIERNVLRNFPEVKSGKFRTVGDLKFIAALADPDASSGVGAETWGFWEKDPGPRGVFLAKYETKLKENGNVAPAGWKFDSSSWWLEEHGIIMETPSKLPLTVGASRDRRYLVTGGRETSSVLTVRSDGRWELSKGNLYDVTHLPCRAAVYTGAGGSVCSPDQENQKIFPVKPGAKMPKFKGCNTQDWAVLFVVGEEVV